MPLPPSAAICEERTATILRIRGLLREFGIVLVRSRRGCARRLVSRLEAPLLARRAIDDLRYLGVLRQDWPTMIRSCVAWQRVRSVRNACRRSPV